MFLDDEHKQRINSKRQPRDKLFGGRKECCISFFLSLSFRKSFVCRVELPQPTSALFLYPSHPPSSPHLVSLHPLSICKAKFILRSLQTPDNGEVSCQSCCRLAAWSPVSWAPGLSSDLQNEAHWLIWARLSESTGCYKSQLRARLPDKTGTTWHCSGRGVWH